MLSYRTQAAIEWFNEGRNKMNGRMGRVQEGGRVMLVFPSNNPPSLFLIQENTTTLITALIFTIELNQHLSDTSGNVVLDLL